MADAWPAANPSAPLGLRQVYENVMQLSGRAGARQVPGNPRLGYTHVYGAPGVSGVTILEAPAWT
jgi:acetyl-CoA C-acetyltransferase